MKTSTMVIAALIAGVAFGAEQDSLKVTADRIAADRNTSALVASGRVVAVSAPMRMMSEYLERDTNGVCHAGKGTKVTTCTNCADKLHWDITGEVEFKSGHHMMLRNAWIHFMQVPVFWLPYLYYPLDGELGFELMVGYTGRWGAYVQSRYSYDLIGAKSLGVDSRYLWGATRLDLRYKNGVALGQELEWSMGAMGYGGAKVYYAWDQNVGDRYGTYTSAMNGWNYQNWGSSVPDNRYGIELKHRVEPTERDVVRGHATIFSDTYFRSDFVRRMTLTINNEFQYYPGNEAAWEHQETWGAWGVSVSGPLTKFDGGTSRLPEFYLDVTPIQVWKLPLNYESQTRVGYLKRSCAEYGDGSLINAFTRNPGVWADYDTFRFDTYHRLTAPFKLWDVLSVVPRVGYHGTYWNDSGSEVLYGVGTADATGDKVFRSIVEGGVTFAGRGTAWLDDGVQHMIEPYMDVLAQEAWYSGLSDANRPYVFDNIDWSSDWSDQFAGRSRNLPYSWYGITPGVRNVLRRADEHGILRTVFDFDAYAALQFNTTTFTEGSDRHKLAEVGKPNYGEHAGVVVPGARIRWFPSDDSMLIGRVEYDSEYNKVAQASVSWVHKLSKRFSYRASFFQRDHRWWDYSSSPAFNGYYDGFNWAEFSYLEIGFEHEVCDQFAWAPYVRWDCRQGELDEIGAWFDVYRTDCLGFRFNLAYENEYARVDGSLEDAEWRVGFYIYLRAFGPGVGIGVGEY